MAPSNASAASNANPPTTPNQPSSNTRPKSPPIPPHNSPRVWFLTAGTSPIGIGVARQALKHGDGVVACITPHPPSVAPNDASASSGATRGVRGRERESGKNDEREGEDYDSVAGQLAEFAEFIEELRGAVEDGRESGGVLKRLKVVTADLRVTAQCQAAIAEAIEVFGRIDIVLGCSSETILGSVEELSQSTRTQALVRDQFETNYFANVNLIRAVLPSMRSRRNGHIIMLTGTTGNLGSPGLSVYCASQWALEGYCDSLAYEIAPFNIKMTIVQPNMEVNILSNRITATPPLPHYSPEANAAPMAREILSGLLSRLGCPPPFDFGHPTSSASSPTSSQDSSTSASIPHARRRHPQQPQQHSQMQQSPVLVRKLSHSSSSGGSTHSTPRPAPVLPPSSPPEPYPVESQLSAERTTAATRSFTPTLAPAIKKALVAETVYALLAIGGHDNPPARHIVGFEGVVSTKEKLKTVSEELEDFLDVSAAVDITEEEEEGVKVESGDGD